jgi:drug/metabolite transporter (DMT)-like permease
MAEIFILFFLPANVCLLLYIHQKAGTLQVNWISTALIAAAMQGVVSIFDSHLLARRMIGMKPFMLAMGIIEVLYGLILYLLFPWPLDMPVQAILAVIGAGVCGAAAVIITLFVLQKEEVSKVIPITHTSPVFVAIIAGIFLGESLGFAQWAAILIVVAGAMIITAENTGSAASGSLKRPFLMLFVASLISAIGNIFTKYVLDYISYWNMYSIAILVAAIVQLSIALRPSTIRQWANMERRNSSLALICFNEILALSASVIYVRSVSLGPVSLVITVMTVRPVLVMLFSLVLSLILPGFLIKSAGKRTLIFRFIAIALIVGGLCIISLS